MKLIQKFSLHKIVNLRQKKYVSICDAKRVGFIFNAREDGVGEAIPLFEKQLQVHKVAFQGIAIDLGDDQSGIPQFQSDPYLINLYKSDTDWKGIPNHSLLTKFLNNHFDIFIDLSLENLFPIEYILESVDSSVIIGFQPDNASKYDILIRNKEDSSPSLSEYVINTFEYLTTIKSNK